MAIFAQYRIWQKKYHNNAFVGFGINFPGMFCNNGPDVFGITEVHHQFITNKANETRVENFTHYN